MKTESLREDEIQALIALIELSDPIETPNNNFYTFYPDSLKAAQSYFRSAAIDITAAIEALSQKGLICLEKDTCLLTPEGEEAARTIRSARPPIWYWYQDFYRAISSSRAYSTYCLRIFGKDLGQHGFSDMEQIEQLPALLSIHTGTRVLDIGCGNGKIAEWLSDQTGARVTGIDYIPLAIEQAKKRTANKKDRLRFAVHHIDELDQIEDTFDAILSIDSIFFGQDMGATLKKMKDRLAPGGMMAIFCGEDLSAELETHAPAYDRQDLSESHYAHLQKKHRVALEMKSNFEAEGNDFIWENQMAESIEDPAPFDPAQHPAPRYLYHVKSCSYRLN